MFQKSGHEHFSGAVAQPAIPVSYYVMPERGELKQSKVSGITFTLLSLASKTEARQP